MAALALAGYGLSRLDTARGPEAVSYATGYNDDFWKYATDGGADSSLPFQHVKSGKGDYVRQMIDWRVVQPTRISPLDFSPYEPLRRQAKSNGLKILPHFLNCSPDFSSPESSGDVRYPSPPNYQNFGAFVAAGMDYFDEVADAAEIWNEPNLPEFGSVPPDVFAALVRASCDAVSYYESINVFGAGSKRVVSGGLAVRGDSTTGNWREYQRDLISQADGRSFDFGLHSYDFRSFDGWAADDLADDIARRALAHVDEATLGLNSDQRVWLTETGVSAKAPLGRSGQARTLVGIAEGLRTRPRCAAMIVHRLYPNPDDRDERPPTSSFFSTAVFDEPYRDPQEAYFGLGFAWGGLTVSGGSAAGRAEA